MRTKRPRVATIGLNDAELQSIASLCGDLRQSSSLSTYLEEYSWTETDILISRENLDGAKINNSTHLMTMGSTFFRIDKEHMQVDGTIYANPSVQAGCDNTERELEVPPSCPSLYKPLATELSGHLSQAARPPGVIRTHFPSKICHVIIQTTSGRPVALRLAFSAESTAFIALVLPEDSNLEPWFRAFLYELHEHTPSRVPQEPPRLSQPSDWYTPQERALADQILQIDSKVQCLNSRREELLTKLAKEGEKADGGTRRALWADGEELKDAVKEMLADFKFTVRDMDAEVKQGKPKHEDLRLTLQDNSEWEAIVEVKGYNSGIKTNDARQVREHRERYITEKHRPPSLTLWLSNPYRAMDPSSRPNPDQNIENAAKNVGAVHALTSDLYRQWALAIAGNIEKETVVQNLMHAEPGLWTPPTQDIGTQSKGGPKYNRNLESA